MDYVFFDLKLSINIWTERSAAKILHYIIILHRFVSYSIVSYHFTLKYLLYNYTISSACNGFHKLRPCSLQICSLCKHQQRVVSNIRLSL